jgi:two-component system response regulator VicR
MNNRIILIEDDPDHVELIKLILCSDGFQVQDSDPELLYADIDKDEPCLILMDNRLHAKSGAQICKELKANSDLRHIPVVLVSAALDLATIAKDSKADGFIEKPFNIDALSETVQNIIHKSKPT